MEKRDPKLCTHCNREATHYLGFWPVCDLHVENVGIITACVQVPGDHEGHLRHVLESHPDLQGFESYVEFHPQGYWTGAYVNVIPKNTPLEACIKVARVMIGLQRTYEPISTDTTIIMVRS